jgi:hypothetical protein
MNPDTSTPSRAEVVDEISKWGVGGGILLTALAPLSLPILILTLVALAPLVVPLLAVALLAGVVALPVLLIRKVARSVVLNRRDRSRLAKAEPTLGPAR